MTGQTQCVFSAKRPLAAPGGMLCSDFDEADTRGGRQLNQVSVMLWQELRVLARQTGSAAASCTAKPKG
jgi:hypothetical protein